MTAVLIALLATVATADPKFTLPKTPLKLPPANVLTPAQLTTLLQQKAKEQNVKVKSNVQPVTLQFQFPPSSPGAVAPYFGNPHFVQLDPAGSIIQLFANRGSSLFLPLPFDVEANKLYLVDCALPANAGDTKQRSVSWTGAEDGVVPLTNGHASFLINPRTSYRTPRLNITIGPSEGEAGEYETVFFKSCQLMVMQKE